LCKKKKINEIPFFVFQEIENSRQRRSLECCTDQDYCNKNLHPTLPPLKPPRKCISLSPSLSLFLSLLSSLHNFVVHETQDWFLRATCSPADRWQWQCGNDMDGANNCDCRCYSTQSDRDIVTLSGSQRWLKRGRQQELLSNWLSREGHTVSPLNAVLQVQVWESLCVFERQWA